MMYCVRPKSAANGRARVIARWPAAAPTEAAAAVRQDGAVVVEGLWTPAEIDELGAAVIAQHPEFLDPSCLQDYLGFEERFIAPITMTRFLSGAGLGRLNAIDRVCGQLLGPDFVYEAFGILMVMPGAQAQLAHRDGGFLFGGSGVDRILPPNALTIAIPLIDVDLAAAPTGFEPGSHRLVGELSADALVPVVLKRGTRPSGISACPTAASPIAHRNRGRRSTSPLVAHSGSITGISTRPRESS